LKWLKILSIGVFKPQKIKQGTKSYEVIRPEG